jgi:hypothetical protein
MLENEPERSEWVGENKSRKGVTVNGHQFSDIYQSKALGHFAM